MAKTGTVKFFNDEKGFGFVVQDDGGDDLFAHRSNLADGQSLVEGDAVRYDEAWDDRKGKSLAENITGGSGGSGGGYGGSFGGGGKGFGGGGKGKGGGACFTCGETGHRAADCPEGGGGKSFGKGGGKGKYQSDTSQHTVPPLHDQESTDQMKTHHREQVPHWFTQVTLSCRWKDQGWGGQKGRLLLALERRGVEVSSIDCFGLVPHDWQQAAVTFDAVKLQNPTDGDVLLLRYVVGGGGGHELHVENCSLVFTQSS